MSRLIFAAIVIAIIAWAAFAAPNRPSLSPDLPSEPIQQPSTALLGEWTMFSSRHVITFDPCGNLCIHGMYYARLQWDGITLRVWWPLNTECFGEYRLVNGELVGAWWYRDDRKTPDKWKRVK